MSERLNVFRHLTGHHCGSRRASLVLVLIVLFAPVAVLAQGFTAEGVARLGAAIERDVADERYPGAVILLTRNGETVHRAFGRLRPGDPTPMPKDALFRIASMTKPVTSVAALMLVEDGRLRLDQPIGELLPAFAAPTVLLSDGTTRPAARPISVRDLLRHTSGLIYGVFEQATPLGRRYREAGIWPATRPLDAWIEALGGLPLIADPNTTWRYGRSTDVLAAVVGEAAGQPADAFLRQRIFGPLGMDDTGFVMPAGSEARMAQTRQRTFDPTVPPAMISGGGGLISTATDYLAFCRMLLRGGGPLLRQETVAEMTRDQLDGIRFPRPGYGFGYGVAVRTGESREPGTVGDYDWSGYYGTVFWIDPARDLIAIGMMQNPSERRYFRQHLRRLVYAALAD